MSFYEYAMVKTAEESERSSFTDGVIASALLGEAIAAAANVKPAVENALSFGSWKAPAGADEPLRKALARNAGNVLRTGRSAGGYLVPHLLNGALAGSLGGGALFGIGSLLKDEN